MRLEDGSNNIIIGYNLGASSPTANNELRIGGIIQGNLDTLALEFNGDVTVAGELTVNDGLVVTTGGMDITGASSIDGDLDIDGDTTIDGTLGVTGEATFDDGVTVTDGGIDVTGNSAFAGDITATGDTTFIAETDSTTTFRIQDAANNTLFNADTTNMRIGIGTETPQYALDVVTADAISARFSGRVIGADAVENDEFITLGQAASLFSAGAGNAFLQGGNDFGETAVLGATDNEALTFITDNTVRLTVEAGGNIATANALSVGGQLTVVGAGTFESTLQAQDTLTVTSGGMDITGDSTIDGNLQFAEGTDRILQMAARTASAAGNVLTIAGGNAGGGGAAFGGGNLVLQGGDAAGTGNANGGSILLEGGLGVGTGSRGQVVISTPSYTTIAEASCSSNCTISQSSIDNNAAVIVSAAEPSLIIAVPDPTITDAGRVVYITAALDSEDFELILNSGASEVNVSMRENSTATLIWNGSDWTAAGASSSTTLQSAYNSTLTSAGGADIVLNNTPTQAGLTVRNNPDNPIIGALFEAQTSIGTNLFSVNNRAIDYASNGGAESAGSSTNTFPSDTWSATPSGGSVSRQFGIGPNVATGQASVQVEMSSTNHGAANRLTEALTGNLRYTVSYTVRADENFDTLETVYSPNGSNSNLVVCIDGSTVTEGSWTHITCTFDAPASGITSDNAIFIRQSDGGNRTMFIDNLSVTVSANVNHAADGDVNDSGAFASSWGAGPAGGAVFRDTSVLFNGNASARAETGDVAGHGVSNILAITPKLDTQYLVTLYAISSDNFDDIRVRYTPNNGGDFVECVDYNTRELSITTWTRITCFFTTDSTTPTDARLVIDQPTANDRTFWVDNLSITLNTNTASNVQIGGGNFGGPPTLLTLDRSDSPPIAANNDAYLGSMYYDTTTGRIQCYEANGWGACGSPPDNIVNLTPEYAGSVLNGDGVGVMTADFCANESGVLDVNSDLCGDGEALNFYRWTSPQATQQTYSIYITYQLPSTFDGFENDDTVQLTARRDNVDAEVSYEMFRSQSGQITQCGTGETIVTTINDEWQTVGINGNEATGCGFNSTSANNYAIFKINMKASNNANAFVSTLSFTTIAR